MLVRVMACMALLGGLAACGDDSDTSDTVSAEDTDRVVLTPAEESEGHDHSTHDHGEDGHDHGDTGNKSGMTGDPDATPADELPDAELRKGEFALLPDAPQGSPEMAGAAYLARTDDGTTLTVDVTGLEPDTDYTSHLHEGVCADGAGDHFKFDADGSDQPPNEVHLIVAADADGGAATTITNENPDSQGVRSMVLHLEDGTKFACADLRG